LKTCYLDCFACGTNYGFKIYKILPFKQILIRGLCILSICTNYTLDLGGGIRIVEMLYKSNFMALVGGGANPKFPINKVIIWDDYLCQVSGEITIGKGTIKSVSLRQNK